MSPISFSVRPSVAAVRFALLGLSLISVAASAQQQENTQAADVLPTINVTSEAAPTGFTAQKATSSTKSDKPLFETPQSVSVLTRELLDTRQVTTLNEALQTSAGVSAGGLGRRGWDDFTIRGQTASDSIYVDGLRLGQANWIAQEVYGVEQIDIIKGPASINFGQMQPGGIVNMISKRPRAEAFNQVGFTVGSYGYRQGTFDFGRPLESENGKAAFRVNGMASDSDDKTDFVYFKNRYIAPSVSLDFGNRTDFTILTSYTTREYIRQQGLPVVGTLQTNPNGQLRRSLFISDPGVGPYEAEQSAIGYALTHRFDSGWTLRQNFRWSNANMTGRAVFASTTAGLGNGNTTQPRQVSLQYIQEHVAALDTNVERAFDLGGINHTVMVGLDVNRDALFNNTGRCAIGALNIYNPVYNVSYNNCATQTNTRSDIGYEALYIRDQMKISDRLNLNIALRHDRANIETTNYTTAAFQKLDSNATTGNVALMYKVSSNIAPYIGYATSFLPVAGTMLNGSQLQPEKGKQSEIGMKFQSDDQRLNASIAYFDLTRSNVTQNDPNNSNFKVQIGEQRSKGFEGQISADLKNGWSLMGALTLLDAVITQDTTTSRVGKQLQNVPKRSANILANYRFGGDLSAWEAGGGIRYESAKTTPDVSFSVPGYTVADANVSYQGKGYRISLSVKNLFDKEYYAGVLNRYIVPLGDPRSIMLKTVFDF